MTLARVVYCAAPDLATESVQIPASENMRSNEIATTTKSTNMYNGPGTQYDKLESDLGAGDIFTVRAPLADGYYQVYNTYAAQIGYLSADAVQVKQVSQLFVPDLYWKDAGGKGDAHWDQLWADARYFGAILKATQGVSLPPAETDWFAYNWDLLYRIGGSDYGVSWFRGCYHFLDLSSGHASGEDQASYFISIVNAAGGLKDGDLPPIVDVELGGSNANSDINDIVDTATAWSNKVQDALGRKPMLYRSDTSSGPATTDHMGCAYLWAKRYNSVLNDSKYNIEQIGWSEAAMWQYTDGDSNYTSYPKSAPGIGANDTSVFLYGNGTLGDVRALIQDSKVKARRK